MRNEAQVDIGVSYLVRHSSCLIKYDTLEDAQKEYNKLTSSAIYKIEASMVKEK